MDETHKKCTRCKAILPITLFTADKSRGDGLHTRCKACDTVYAKEKRTKNPENNRKNVAVYRAKNKEALNAKVSAYNKRAREEKNPQFYATRRALHAKRKLILKQAIPIWADAAKIRCIYVEAVKQGMHVDHIVPLQSPVVCGLHVENNLQLLSLSDNCSKRNSFWPDMP